MDHQPFSLTSPAFHTGAIIPDFYTCKGKDISPPLHLEGIPDGTASLALIVHDPDAPAGDFLHWSLWNISPITNDIDEDIPPVDTVEGTNDFGETGYSGPCPPSGTHRYEFDLYALNKPLKLRLGASKLELEGEMRSCTIAKTTLIGLASA